jgi:hypothetical protein
MYIHLSVINAVVTLQSSPLSQGPIETQAFDVRLLYAFLNCNSLVNFTLNFQPPAYATKDVDTLVDRSLVFFVQFVIKL